nr:hypothetical protein GCM10025699_15880 [Microbacterium flavescens]
MKPSPLPPEFSDVAFTVSEAHDAGLRPRRLRAADLRTPHHGVRAPADAVSASLEARCGDLLPRLEPLHIYAGPTALALWGAPLPGWTERYLHVGALLGVREPRIPGVVGHRFAFLPEDATLLRGLPVPPPAEAWAQSADRCGSPNPERGRYERSRRPPDPLKRRFLTVDELTAAADYLLTDGLADREELVRVAEVARRRGAVALREAAEFARAGSESPKESELRLLVVRGGSPEPELNWNLTDASSALVARLDLAYPQYRVAVEYDGRHHAEASQFSRDADRWAAIADHDWILIRAVAHDLADEPRRLLRRIERALRSRGWPDD